MFNATRIGELVECPWCEESFQRRQHAQIYCTTNCKDSAKTFRRKYGPDANRPPARPCENCGGPLPVRSDSVRFCGKPECQSVSRRDTWQNRAERCTEPGCDRPVNGRGLCASHYANYWRKNNPERAREIGRAAGQRRRALETAAFVEDVDMKVLLERDGWKCGICGGRIPRDVDFPHLQSPTLDHVIPLSAGGEHSYANSQVAHYSCNSAKGNRGGGEQLAFL